MNGHKFRISYRLKRLSHLVQYNKQHHSKVLLNWPPKQMKTVLHGIEGKDEIFKTLHKKGQYFLQNAIRNNLRNNLLTSINKGLIFIPPYLFTFLRHGPTRLELATCGHVKIINLTFELGKQNVCIQKEKENRILPELLTLSK